MSAAPSSWKFWAVWACRVVAGAVFIASGWAKAVDPHGFALKIDEYLAVWHMGALLPDGTTGVLGSAISVFELCIGVLLLTGSLRRSAPILGLAMMAFWLPLTAYIAVADPVADCGCFGDMIVLSNTATLVKNILLTAVLALCLAWHRAAAPLYRPGLQWLVPALTAIYGIVIAFIGWNVQPVVDFRPYPIGSTLTDGNTVTPYTYIYSKDGEERRFSLDELPDSTWEFERAIAVPTSAPRGIPAFDGDEEVSDDIFAPEEGTQTIVLAFTQPGLDDLMRSRMANEIYEYASEHGIDMLGLVAASGTALEQWKELARPEYPVYSANAVALKQLVRGPIGMIYMRDGRVVWKRNFTTLPADLLDSDDPLGSVLVVDDGRVAAWLSIFFAGGLLLLLAISRLTTVSLRLSRKYTKTDQDKPNKPNDTTDSNKGDA